MKYYVRKHKCKSPSEETGLGEGWKGAFEVEFLVPGLQIPVQLLEVVVALPDDHFGDRLGRRHRVNLPTHPISTNLSIIRRKRKAYDGGDFVDGEAAAVSLRLGDQKPPHPAVVVQSHFNTLLSIHPRRRVRHN